MGGTYPADMSWPDPTALELLVAVADRGSLAAAARATGVAQPNASRSVQRLERRLGVTLLVRTTTGSRLTPHGTVAVEWARQVLVANQQLVDGAARLAGAGGGTVRVAASQTIAEHLLPQWISQSRAVSGTAVRVEVGNSTAVAGRVRDGGADVGFVEDPRPPRGLRSTVVGHDEMVLVVAPGHPWARRRRPVTVDLLAATALVTREPGSGTRQVLDQALGEHGPAIPAQELSSNAAVRVAAAAGTAPAVLSRLAVEDAVARGQLAIVPVADLDLRRPLRAVWAGPRRLPGAAGDLVDVARGSGRP